MHVLLTCGIGDFIAMESYFTAAERAAVSAVHWASRARSSLMSLVPHVFPNATHVIERDTWGAAFTKTFCISSRAELPGLDPSVRDFSIKVIIDEAKKKVRRHEGSTLVTKALADISRLELPPRYLVVHPYSENARTPIRDLTLTEWNATHAAARHRNLPIVIINRGGQRFPSAPDVIDFTDALTLLEAIEVTKKACGFVGAASVFSVVAAKVLPHDRLWIKGSIDLRRNFAWFYYAPHATNNFVYQNLGGAVNSV